MSKGNKKQYKQFAINSLEDGCLVLKSLIVPVIIDLEKFRNYSDEAEVLLEKYKLDGFIPANIYDSKLATTSSTGGLLLALQRAIVTARPKGRYRKHFCWPAIKRLQIPAHLTTHSAKS